MQQSHQKREEISDVHKTDEGRSKVLCVKLVGKSNANRLHGAKASGIKSYEASYIKSIVVKPLNAGLGIVSKLLQKSNIAILHDLGADMENSEML